MAKMTRTKKSQAIAKRDENKKVDHPLFKLKDQLEKRKDDLAKEMMSGINLDAQIGAVISIASSNPYLLSYAKQNPASLYMSVYQACRLGLNLEPQYKHCYLVPFEGRINLIIDFRGLLLIAMRSGMISSANVKLIYSNEEFYEEINIIGGRDESRLVHRPKLDDRGDLVGGYATFRLPDGTTTYRIMPASKIYHTRDNSPSVKHRKAGRQSPWDTHFEEMARKTILKWGFKLIPLTNDVARALAVDDDDSLGEQRNALSGDTVSVTLHDNPNETEGEVDNAPDMFEGDLTEEVEEDSDPKDGIDSAHDDLFDAVPEPGELRDLADDI